MSLINYIKFQKNWIISFIISCIIINCVLFSSITISASYEDIIYMNILVFLIHLFSMILDYKNHARIYNYILKDDSSKLSKYNYNYNLYINLISKISNDKNNLFLEKEAYYKKKINELQEYLIQWVHDIKVNISVCELILEQLEVNHNTNTIFKQIEKIRFNINQILFVSRAAHYNQDISCENVDVCKELRNAIKDNSFFFINKNISIETNLTPIIVNNDRKWINYIFCQILNNSSKYTPQNGNIIITSKETRNYFSITIKDNGIGIPKEDLQRIFDKGFTGQNGRNSTKSTGMGLYYAKNMADLLHIKLDVSSEEGVYTQFEVTFYKISDYYDLQIS